MLASVAWITNIVYQTGKNYKPIDRIRTIIRIRPMITDTHFELVMSLLYSKLAVLLFAALGKAEPLISTAARQKFDFDLLPWPMTLTSTFDLDLWPLTLKQCNIYAQTRFFIFDLRPTTLTYIPSLA